MWSLPGVSLSSSTLLPKKKTVAVSISGKVPSGLHGAAPRSSPPYGRALSPSPPDRPQPSHGWKDILSHQDGDPGAWLWWTERTQENGTHPINHKEPNEAQTPGDGPGGDFQAPR